MSGFTIENVSKVYGGDLPTISLQHINLQVRDGEFLCVLGPSGCGKARCWSCWRDCSFRRRATFCWMARRFRTHAELWGRIPGCIPVPVAHHFAERRPWAGARRHEKRSGKRSWINISTWSAWRIRLEISTSFIGRHAAASRIARALVSSPSILLMDEPFGAVDHLTRLQLQQDLLRIWQEEKKTVVFVTHDVSEAVFLADRVVLPAPRAHSPYFRRSP